MKSLTKIGLITALVAALLSAGGCGGAIQNLVNSIGAARIDSISPTSGPAGTVVTITGDVKMMGTTNGVLDWPQSNQAVYVDGVAARSSQTSQQVLTVTIPAGTAPGTVEIKVQNGVQDAFTSNYLLSNGKSFTVTP